MSHTQGEKKNHASDRISRLFSVSKHISVVLIQKNIFLKLIPEAPGLETLDFLHMSHHQIALDLQNISGTQWQEKWNQC